MATSGTINGTVSMNGDKLSFYATWSAKPNTAGNYSDVTVKSFWRTTSTGWNFNTVGSRNASITINGSTQNISKVFSIYWDTVGNPYQIQSYTCRVPHNNDGSKSITISAYADGTASSYGPGKCSAQATVTLDKIPRGATIASAPDFTDEDNPIVKVSNPAGVAVELGVFKDGTHAIADYRTISGTSYTFNFTKEERDKLRQNSITSNKSQVRFYIRSVVGGQTFITYLTKTLTIRNPQPTLNPVVQDVNEATIALTGDRDTVVRRMSNMQVTVGAAAVKFATIKSVKVVNGNKQLTGDGVIEGSDSGTFVVSVTDSRGNTTTRTIVKNVINYTLLTCYVGSNVPNALGEFQLECTGAVYDDTFGLVENSITVDYRFRERYSEEWSPWTPMLSASFNQSYTAQVDVTELDYKKTYEFQCRVTDKLATVESSIRVVVSRPIFDWSSDDFKFYVPVSLVTYNEDGSSETRSLYTCGITARISGTVALSGGEKNLPINTALCAYGGAKVSNNAVVINAEGIYAVAASVYFASTASVLYCGAYIRANGVEVSSLHSGIANGVGGIAIPPTLVKLIAGSTITLSAYTASGSSATVNNDPRTRLTVYQVN